MHHEKMFLQPVKHLFQNLATGHFWIEKLATCRQLWR